ncbi:MAG: PqqD family protein [Acidimicrobiales bacterium]
MSQDADNRPVARDDIEIYEADDGLLIYDLQRDRAHHLNSTAGIIFSMCTGQTTVDDMVGHLQEAFGLPQPPQDEVLTCLEDLRGEGLLT